jgi:hypothetical protein
MGCQDLLEDVPGRSRKESALSPTDIKSIMRGVTGSRSAKTYSVKDETSSKPFLYTRIFRSSVLGTPCSLVSLGYTVHGIGFCQQLVCKLIFETFKATCVCGEGGGLAERLCSVLFCVLFFRCETELLKRMWTNLYVFFLFMNFEIVYECWLRISSSVCHFVVKSRGWNILGIRICKVITHFYFCSNLVYVRTGTAAVFQGCLPMDRSLSSEFSS